MSPEEVVALIIRRATIDDSKGIHEAHMDSIQKCCAKAYSDEEIKAWGHRPYNEANRQRSILEELVWVLEDAGQVVGYSHLSPDGILRALYLRPEATGQGYGKKMLQISEAEARRLGIKELRLIATLNAVDFYEANGYARSGPEEKVQIQGVGIRCLPMRKALD
jgi:putative acetyltransferase